MMTFQSKIKEVPGLLYIADSMELMSAIGRRRMMEQPFLTNPRDLASEQDATQLMLQSIQTEENGLAVDMLRHQLMQLHDLKSTLQSLHSHIIVNEVELFEIKNFSHLCGYARRALLQLGLHDRFPLPDLTPVFQMLDPDNTGIPNFYIYDSYDSRLAPIRREMKTADDTRMSELLAIQNDIQQQVITHLCDQLQPHAVTITKAMEQMAYIDLVMARAYLARDWHLTRPSQQHDTASLHALVNPRLKQHNESIGLRYQPIDIDLIPGVTLITGANMAGKTVLLKSVGIAQLMYQFGFPIPCNQAVMTPVDDVVFCIGDEQNEMNGLSSFASEITRISEVVDRSQQQRLLILIDEPARTTNPVEGKALVQAIITLLHSRHSFTLVTTHYSQLGTPCRRLRVKGFVEGMVDTTLTAQNINRFIDYSLVVDDSDEVPQEALRIAEMLACNPDIIALARQNLRN